MKCDGGDDEKIETRYFLPHADVNKTTSSRTDCKSSLENDKSVSRNSTRVVATATHISLGKIRQTETTPNRIVLHVA
jgi:hypothetical protein